MYCVYLVINVTPLIVVGSKSVYIEEVLWVVDVAGMDTLNMLHSVTRQCIAACCYNLQLVNTYRVWSCNF